MAKQVRVLKEGVTGKMLIKKAIENNNRNKEELKSLSFNIKQVLKHDKELLKLLGLSKSEITPANLLPHFMGKELIDGKTCFWFTQRAVNRYAKSKAKSKAKK